MPEELGKEILVESAKEVAKEVYGDALKPAVKSVGNIIALPFQAIDAALSKPKLWVAEKQYNYERTRELLAEKLKNVPEEDIVPPENYVAIPALQQISYCFDSDELRDMYANLLASSMKKDTKWSVHPAFVDIIKQLTPDEAKELKYLNSVQAIPMLGINAHKHSGGYTTVIPFFTNLPEICNCERPMDYEKQINNLARLGLIEVNSTAGFVDKTKYEPLKNHGFIKASLTVLENNENVSRYTFIEGMIELTAFGKDFCKVCLG